MRQQRQKARRSARCAVTGLLAKPLVRELRVDTGVVPPWFDGTLEQFRTAASWYRDSHRGRFSDCIELLCFEIGQVPAEMSDGEWSLFFKFAERFVPAFQVPANRGRPTLLDLEGRLRLVIEIGLTQNGHTKRWKKPLADRLCNEPYFKKRRIKSETIRAYIKECQTAPSALRAGKASEFQRQLIEDLALEPHNRQTE